MAITPEGFPLAYDVLAGNTNDKTTSDFLKKIEQQYGQARRIWIMDRGIPTEVTLTEMKTSLPVVSYLVGTPRGRLSKLEKAFLALPWEKAQESVEVKLLPQQGELYILARSTGRMLKERSIRRRRLKQLWKRLHELQQQKLKRDELLLKLRAAKTQAGTVYRLVEIQLPGKSDPVTPQTFTFTLRRDQLRLDDWTRQVARFVRVVPHDYRRVLEAQARMREKGLAAEEAEMAVFELNARDAARVGGN